MSWIVLDPITDKAIASGFNEAEDAVAWVRQAFACTQDAERIELLKRCVVAPFDPKRDS